MKDMSKVQLAAALAATLGFSLHGTAQAANTGDQGLRVIERQAPIYIASSGDDTQEKKSMKGKEGSCKGKDGSCKGKDGSMKGKEGSCKGKEGSCKGKDGAMKGKEGSCKGKDSQAQ